MARGNKTRPRHSNSRLCVCTRMHTTLVPHATQRNATHGNTTRAQWRISKVGNTILAVTSAHTNSMPKLLLITTASVHASVPTLLGCRHCFTANTTSVPTLLGCRHCFVHLEDWWRPTQRLCSPPHRPNLKRLRPSAGQHCLADNTASPPTLLGCQHYLVPTLLGGQQHFTRCCMLYETSSVCNMNHAICNMHQA